MGLTTVLVEDEGGRTIREMVAHPGVLDPLLASIEQNGSFHCLRFVDPYGDTLFNRAQAEQLLEELKQLSGLARTPAERSALNEIADLTRFCLEQPHRYLRLKGD